MNKKMISVISIFLLVTIILVVFIVKYSPLSRPKKFFYKVVLCASIFNR